MPSKICTRRDFSVRLAAIFPAIGLGNSALLFSGRPRTARPAADDEISHSAEAIHQEVAFKAPRKRVYDALTETKQFDKVVQLSAAMQSGMIKAATPTEISREPGGAFTIFGGHILGRQVELVPSERIVQAWRVANWNAGVYSIVKFELTELDSGTTLVLDHAGFPVGGAQHYAEGWKVNYWEPLAKYLA